MKKSLIITILSVILILGLGGAGFWLWHRNQQLTDTNSQQSDDIDSLRRQLAEAKAVPTPSPTPTPAPLADVVLKDFAVSYTPTSDISDVSATYTASTKLFAFTSKSLAAKGGECAVPGALGNLSRLAKGASAGQSTSAKVATVGAYDYYYGAPSVGCSQIAGAAAIQTAQSASLKTALSGLH